MKLKSILAACSAFLVFSCSMQPAYAQGINPFKEPMTFEQQTKVCDMYSYMAQRITVHRHEIDNLATLLEITNEDNYSTSIVMLAYRTPRLSNSADIAKDALENQEVVKQDCYSKRSKTAKRGNYL
jgi:hypothetical protein